ncbi:MAG: tape measure protein, partial [Candidatus Paceibacterota bacterium]
MKKSAQGAAKEIDYLKQSLSGIENKLSFGALIAGLTLAARKSVEMADSWKLASARMSLVATGTNQLREAENGLFEVSQKTRSGYIESVNLYTRMARALKDTNFNQQDFLQITETVNKTLRISGASTSEASAGVLQFSQALASGKLAGDEFKSISENIPRLAEAIAKGMGVPRAALKEMAAEGKLTTEKIAEALQSQRRVVDTEFTAIPKTIGDAGTHISNTIGKMIQDFDRFSSATEILSSKLIGLSSDLGIAADGFALFWRRAFAVEPKGVEAITDRIAELDEAIEASLKQRSGSISGVFWTSSDEKNLLSMEQKLRELRRELSHLGEEAKKEAEEIKWDALWKEMQEGAQKSSKEITKFIEKLKEKSISLSQGEKALLEAKMTEMGFNDIQKKEALGYQAIIDGIKEQKKEHKELAETYREVDKALKDYGADMFDYLDKYAQKYKEMRTAHDLSDAEEISRIDREMWEDSIASAKAAKKKIEDDAKASLKKQEDDNKHYLERVQDATADTFYDIFKNTEEGFSGLFDRIGDYFLKMLAEMAAQAIAKPIIIPIVQALTSGVGGADTASSLAYLANGSTGTSWLNTGSDTISLLKNGYNSLSSWIGGTSSGSMLGTASQAAAYQSEWAAINVEMGGAAAEASSFASVLKAASPYLMAYAAGSLGYSTLGKSMGLPQGEYSSMGAGAGAAAGAYVGGSTAVTGWLAGTKMGSALGSYVGPVGTIVGAIVGTIIGGVAGSFIGGDGNRHMSLLSQPELSYGGEVNYSTGGYDYDAYRNRSITDTSTNPYYGSAFGTLEDATNEAAAKIWASVDETLALFPEDVAAGVRENLSKLVFTFNEDKSWVLASDKFQEGMTNILTVFTQEIYDGIQPVIQDGFAKYAQSLVEDQTLTGLFGRLSENNILKTSLGDTSLFAADYGMAAGANFDTYMETVSAWLSSFAQLESAFASVDTTVQNILSPLSAFDAGVANVNNQFDGLKSTLYALGASTKELEGIENQRRQAIDNYTTKVTGDIHDKLASL